jgi:hypothetical protein
LACRWVSLVSGEELDVVEPRSNSSPLIARPFLPPAKDNMDKDCIRFALWAFASALVAAVFAGPAVIFGVVVGLVIWWAYYR